MEPGESRTFMNLLQVTVTPHDDAVQARALSSQAAMVRSLDGRIELLGSRTLSDRQIEVQAELYRVEAGQFNLIRGKQLHCGVDLLSSDKRLTIECDLVRGVADIRLDERSRLTIAAGDGRVQVNGKTLNDTLFDNSRLMLTLEAGQHQLGFTPAREETVLAMKQALVQAWDRSRVPPVTPPGLKSDAPQMTRVWHWAPDSPGRANTRVLVAADVNGDGQHELLVGGEDNLLRCIDGQGQVLWEFEADEWVCSTVVRDLDRDGSAEVLVGTGIYPTPKAAAAAIYILDGNGKQLARIPAPVTAESTPANKWGSSPGAIEVIDVLDVDGDNTREIIAGSANMTVFCLRPDGQQVWNAFNYAHRPTNLQFHDVNGDGTKEIVCATSFYETNVFNLDGEHVYRIKSPGPGLAVGDLDGDGNADFIGGSRHGPVSVTRYDSAIVEFRDWIDSKPGIWTAPVTWSFDTGAEVNEVHIVQLQPTESKQVVACSRNSIVYTFNADGSVLWGRPLGDGVRGLDVADLNGDGTTEIIAGNDAGQVFMIDASGHICAQAEVPGLVRFIQTADMNGDGTHEIIVATDGPSLTAFQWRP